MWQRTKRLINSYLDELIEKSNRPDREAREVTRSEFARLSELEVQTRASAKMLEKELAEVELKILGAAERERIARAQGEAASPAGTQLLALSAQRDLIKQQLGEANAAADRARALREERKRIGEELAADTHLTAMRENLSSIQAPFDSTDPAATIEEMRGRIGSAGGFSTDARVAEADRELASERARSKVDDMLARYKQGLTGASASDQGQETARTAPTTVPDADARQSADETAAQSKTLGRTDGPVRPID